LSIVEGKADRVLLAVLLACGLRRHEAVNLDFSHIQQRKTTGPLYLKGKAGHTRTVPMPGWVKALIDEWIQGANLTAGKLIRRVNKNGSAWGDGLTEKAVWHVVREHARKAGIERLAPHDLRRTCARLCHSAGGELEQIQFLLGHVSIQTTERYLGCKQRIRSAVNDQIGIEPAG
jgi:site-specific recombinase XerD